MEHSERKRTWCPTLLTTIDITHKEREPHIKLSQRYNTCCYKVPHIKLSQSYNTSCYGDDKQPTIRLKEKATDAERVRSVGTLAKNFMNDVRVGANDVFAASALAPANSAAKSASSRAAAPVGTEQASGLPREYEMVKAACRNWLSAVALTGIGPLSRKIATAGGGFEPGALWLPPTTATWW